MKRWILPALIALACTSHTAGAAAAPHDATPAGFAQARQQFSAGTAGNGAARDAAADAFHALAQANPGHPLLAAYEGAAISLKGRDALNPMDKMKYAEKGATMIEKALQQLGPEHDDALVEGAPESLLTRLAAANRLLALPEFMHRAPIGKRAVQAALASPVFEHAPAAVRSGLYLAAARAAALDNRRDDEIAALRKAAAIDPGSHAATGALARLKELGQ